MKDRTIKRFIYIKKCREKGVCIDCGNDLQKKFILNRDMIINISTIYVYDCPCNINEHRIGNIEKYQKKVGFIKLIVQFIKYKLS